MTALPIILKCRKATAKRGRLLEHLGNQMFLLYTQHGFPFECFLDELKDKVSREEKVMILYHYQVKFMEHQLKAGMNDKNQKKHQETNRKQIIQLFDKGELF